MTRLAALALLAAVGAGCRTPPQPMPGLGTHSPYMGQARPLPSRGVDVAQSPPGADRPVSPAPPAAEPPSSPPTSSRK